MQLMFSVCVFDFFCIVIKLKRRRLSKFRIFAFCLVVFFITVSSSLLFRTLVFFSNLT